MQYCDVFFSHYNTAHRILTSDEIISAKRQSIEIKERKEKEKRDRMEMRENKKAMANKKPKIVKKNTTEKIHEGHGEQKTQNCQKEHHQEDTCGPHTQ